MKRALGLTSLTLYGLGTIIGAGIYVLIGGVAARAGMAAPLSFLLAGTMAAFTGLSYAELGQRFPEAAGAAAFAREGFRSAWMGRLTGFAQLLVALVAAATVARGGAGYLLQMIDVPLPLAGGFVIVLFTAIAAWGVRESVFLAAAMTVVETLGLGLVIVVGGDSLAALPTRWEEFWPTAPATGGVGWSGVAAGTFLAFFAFAGFENMVNMAEEVRNVRRTLPWAIVLAIVISSILYLLVVAISVLNVPPSILAASDAPLCEVIDCRAGGMMAAFVPIALIATLNGVLIEIVMMARVTYGMARRGWLPAWLAKVHDTRRTPLTATLIVGAMVTILTVSLEFDALARLTSAALLIVFLIVNVSLIRLKRRTADKSLALKVPIWVPLAGAVSSTVLLATEIAALIASVGG